MIRLTVATNSKRTAVVVEPTACINDVIDMANISTTGAALHLDGSIVLPDEYDMPLEDFGIEDETEATLTAIVKADSAAGCNKGGKKGKGGCK